MERTPRTTAISVLDFSLVLKICRESDDVTSAGFSSKVTD